ncbi:MAG: hypothetical protein JXQ74_00190 [Alphaproteobacteria bacterium]|nr:hypothetical protein [Alphaproteobacteria bacterium]
MVFTEIDIAKIIELAVGYACAGLILEYAYFKMKSSQKLKEKICDCDDKKHKGKR